MSVIGNASTFGSECTFLLEDLTGKIPFAPSRNGGGASIQDMNDADLVYEEKIPSQKIEELFSSVLELYKQQTAELVETLARKIIRQYGERVILVSLAGTGSPIGVLINRVFKMYGLDIPHYSISFIHGKGIDANALDFIRRSHPTGKIAFIDGWTGKGTVKNELEKSISEYNRKNETNISCRLAVLSDPAKILELSATKEDVCIPSACMESTVNGLVSHTVCSERFAGDSKFHGAVICHEFESHDRTMEFLDSISGCFHDFGTLKKFTDARYCEKAEFVRPVYLHSVFSALKDEFPLVNMNKIKLGIGESSRTVACCRPIAVIINKNIPKCGTEFVCGVAQDKEIPCIECDIKQYQCAVITE